MRQPFLVRIEGARQGTFPAESEREGAEGAIEGIGWHYEVEAGERGGRAEHGPVTITKSIGPASPALFQALVTGETLVSVRIEFLGATAEGVLTVVHRVVLTDARVERIEQHSPEDDDLRWGELEDVSFSFASIQMEQPRTGLTGSDTLNRGAPGVRPSPRRQRDR